MSKKRSRRQRRLRKLGLCPHCDCFMNDVWPHRGSYFCSEKCALASDNYLFPTDKSNQRYPKLHILYQPRNLLEALQQKAAEGRARGFE